MPIRIVHEFLQETEDGYLLTLYLSHGSQVEFADEPGGIGVLPAPTDDHEIVAYVRRRHPKRPISKLRLVTGDAKILILPYMTVLAEAHSRK